MNAAPGKHVAIYVRVSDPKQKKGYSLPTQLEGCRQFAAERGYSIVAEFTEAHTSTELDRPELDRARDLARSGAITGLILYELDRLSRGGIVHQLIIEDEFKRSGVDIEYVLADYQDTPEGQLQKSVRAVVAEYERAKMLERVTRGRRGRAQAGHVLPGGVSKYGYQYVSDPAGHKGTLAIIPDERPVIELIYRWYTQGDESGRKLGTRAIARKLSALRIPTRYDGTPNRQKKRQPGVWNFSTVAKILSDETYCGTWYYNKKVGKTGQIRDRSEWIAVAVPAIVDRATFLAAQQQAKENGWNSPRNTQHEYLMRGHVRCAVCGGRMGVRTDSRPKTPMRYYLCPGQRPENALDGHTCQCKRLLRAELIDGIVWEYVYEVLQNPQATIAGMREQQEAEQAEIAPIIDRLAFVDGKIQEHGDERTRWLELYATGKITRQVMDERIAHVENALAQFEAEGRDLRAQLVRPDDVTDEDIEQVAIRCEQIRQGIDYFNFEDRRQTVEWLKVTADIRRGATPDEDKIKVRGLFTVREIALTSAQCEQRNLTIPFTHTLALRAYPIGA